LVFFNFGTSFVIYVIIPNESWNSLKPKTMKKLIFLISFLFIGLNLAKASTIDSRNYYKDAIIFVEGGVEFAIYPNGEFDFYYNPEFQRTNAVNISAPNVNISYNAGYNYEPYLQYDDYGAVIQIESVPVYYDYYGRIIRAGGIYIDYNRRGRINRLGGLHINYNRFNRITNYSGYINNYNRNYVYRPWHQFYSRPRANVSVVFGQPYRAYYRPHRTTYVQHVNYYNNHYTPEHNFYRPNQKVVSYSKGRRTSGKRDLDGLAIRENRYVSSSDNEVRSNRTSRRNSGKATRRRSETSSRSNGNNSRERAVRTSNSAQNTNARKARTNNSRNTATRRSTANQRSSNNKARSSSTSNRKNTRSSSRNSSETRSTPTRSRSRATKSRNSGSSKAARSNNSNRKSSGSRRSSARNVDNRT